LLSEITDVVRRFDVVIPRDLLTMLKALAMVSGIVTQLDPELDMLELLEPKLKQSMRNAFAPSRLGRGATIWGWHLLSVVRQAPRQLRDGLRRAATGAWQLNVRHENIDRLIQELDRSSNRLSFAIVIAAIIVGSSVVISTASDLTVLDIKIQYVGILGYLVAGVLGTALAWAIFRSGRLH
jgi:ubiquinone biosynthesis protein